MFRFGRRRVSLGYRDLFRDMLRIRSQRRIRFAFGCFPVFRFLLRSLRSRLARAASLAARVALAGVRVTGRYGLRRILEREFPAEVAKS